MTGGEPTEQATPNIVGGSESCRVQHAGTNQCTRAIGNRVTMEISVVPSDFTGTIGGSGTIQPALFPHNSSFGSCLHKEHPNTMTIARIVSFSHRSTTCPSIACSQHAAEPTCKPPPVFCVKTQVAADNRNTRAEKMTRGRKYLRQYGIANVAV